MARQLAAGIVGCQLYLERKTGYRDGDDSNSVTYYDLPLRPVLQKIFSDNRRLVVFLPVGATVRILAPLLVNKTSDAAVVCVDDAGRHAVSVLSGHRGGADALAREVSAAIGAAAVITSASDALGVTPVDIVGRELGWAVEATATELTRAAAAVVNGDRVALWIDPEANVSWPCAVPLGKNIVAVDAIADVLDGAFSAALLVTDGLTPLHGAIREAGISLVVYRPPTMVAGIGCRRGVEVEHLRELLARTMEAHALSIKSVAALATADIKADEDGIVELAEEFGVPLHTFTPDQLNDSVAGHGKTTDSACGVIRPTPSAANQLLGVYGVSEPAAMLAANSRGLIVPRTKSDRATVAVARIEPRPKDY
ncbi:Cobalt-precorrin-5A hydrolase [Geodia barretti]|uniref:Cobalt-precorrin-5A hydrolase n=1 Tax=Geodia barretti TaxID=519541 RepID=A0AA35U0C1_GEOBA|nr:Cobalt-precorrin-5A hydrolase [Geodia barretti]